MRTMPVWIAVCVLASGGAVCSEPAESTSAEGSSVARDTGIPLERIIAAVAKKTGKKYLIDPRVRAQVQIVGQDVSSITYSDLLTILQVHGYMAADIGGYVRVVPDANARQTAIPQLSGHQEYPDAEFVSAVIPVKNGPAGFLVPILRPLLPQMAHLAAAYCSNSLLIVDSFANVKRIEALVQALDTGTPYKPEKCEMANPGAHRDNP